MNSCARRVQSLRLLRPHLPRWRSLPKVFSSCVSRPQPAGQAPNDNSQMTPSSPQLLTVRGGWWEQRRLVGRGGAADFTPIWGLACIGRHSTHAAGELHLISPQILSPFPSSSPSSSSSTSSSSCLHQSQPRGFLVVWGFPRWWLHVPLPPHTYSPVDKAPRAWAPPRKLNPRDPKPRNLWNGRLHWETSWPQGFQHSRQWWLPNKDRRGEGVDAEAVGGDLGGGDGEHHQCQPSWWRLGLVGGVCLLHDPYRWWVHPNHWEPDRCPILPFQPTESPTPLASSSSPW